MSYLSDVMALAAALHEVTCKIDHESQCNWYEEEKSDAPIWGLKDHARFLVRANRMIETTGLHPADIIKVLREL